MKLKSLKSEQIDQEFRVSVDITSDAVGEHSLWFAAPVEYGRYIADDRMDGFLVGMLYPAMQYGEDIHIEGVVSEQLLFNINNYVIPLIMSFTPSCKEIVVTATETTTAKKPVEGIGTGFSAGIDSFCTLFDHFELEESENYRINNLLFLNVGSHGKGNTDAELASSKRRFISRYEYLKSFPAELNLDFIRLDSNLHHFHPWGHQKTCTLTAASGILILQNLFAKYYFASFGMNYKEIISDASMYRDYDIGGYSDAILLPLLSTETLQLIPDGNRYTRTEKLLHIASYPPVRRYLNVCVGQTETYENCSRCSKCSRTLTMLKIAGLMNEFSEVFDIGKFEEKIEKRYFHELVLAQSEDIFARQIISFAKQSSVKPPTPLASSLYLYARKHLLVLKRTGIGKLPGRIIRKSKRLLKKLL